MRTRRLNKEYGDIDGLCREAARILRGGGVVALPTETIYGLAANGLDAAAVGRLFAIKGRPPEKPISLLVCAGMDLNRLCANIPDEARLLMERFWPGPLTIVLKSSHLIPDVVTAGSGTVGLRSPRHALTEQILQAANLPLAAPSANLSGAASPTTAAEVLAALDGDIDAIVDGGQTELGVASTVLDMTGTPKIIRLGGLRVEEIEALLGDVAR